MSRRRALVLVTVGLALVVYVATHARIGTDITNFMPDRNRSEFAALSTRLADSAFTRTMVLSVEAPDLDDAVAVAQELATRLRGHPEIAWVRDGIEDERLREVFELYFPRRHALLSEDPEREIPEWLSDEALRERAQSLRLRLASPAATLLEDLASTDPIATMTAGLVKFSLAISSIFSCCRLVSSCSTRAISGSTAVTDLTGLNLFTRRPCRPPSNFASRNAFTIFLA